MDTYENKKQDQDIRDIWKALEGKVSWVIFWAMIVVFLGFFVYFGNADVGLASKIEKNDERFYQFQDRMNANVSAICQKVGAQCK